MSATLTLLYLNCLSGRKASSGAEVKKLMLQSFVAIPVGWRQGPRNNTNLSRFDFIPFHAVSHYLLPLISCFQGSQMECVDESLWLTALISL